MTADFSRLHYNMLTDTISTVEFFFTQNNPYVYPGVNENKSAFLKIRGKESGTAKQMTYSREGSEKHC